MLLTLGVPTYNRARTVSRMLHNLLDEPKSALVKIIVIDDGGADDAYVRLSNDSAISSRVRVLSNEVNLGYSRTFVRILTECDTEYAMLVADDDQVDVESLEPLLAYLALERPSFVSPQFLKGSTIYRGRTVTAPIAPSEFLTASAHASGLIYRVEDCRDALVELAELTDAGNAAAVVYPQVVVLTRLLIASYKCEWLALPTVNEGTSEPSGIRDPEGQAYWSLESRWKQLKAFDSLLSRYLEDGSIAAQEILDAHRARVFFTVHSAIRDESPLLGAAFDSGAQNRYGGSPPSLIGSLPITKWTARRLRALRRSS